MEGEVIAVIISCCVSGLLLAWKLIKKIRKSKCYLEDENGKKIVIDFNLVESEVEKEIEETTGKLTDEQRKKIKKILSNTLKKISSGEIKKVSNKIENL